jgi:hypothetical protein
VVAVKRTNSEKAAFRIGLLTWAAVLILGSALSGFGVVFARGHGYEGALRWLGFLTVTLWFGGLVCLGMKVLQVTENRKRQRTPPNRVSTKGEYVAEYSVQNRGVAIGLAAFFGVLTAFLEVRSTHTTGVLISAAFFCFFIWYAVQVIVTRVHFAKDRIIARLPWSRGLSEPYWSVLQLRPKPGTLDVQFSDGRSLKLHSGLGDPDIILAYLHEHCPPSVRLEKE